MRRLAMAVTAAGTLLLAGVAGCGSDGGPRQAGPPDPPDTVTPAGQPTTIPPPTTGAPTGSADSPSPEPPASTDPPPASATGPANLRLGASGEQVERLQARLQQLGYWIGQVDGEFGAVTQQAVYALQKAADLERDGVVGPRTRQALDDGVRPSARSEQGRMVEVDLDRQLMMLVDNGRVAHIFNTSTGTFAYYTHEGQQYLADTPSGHWEVGWEVDAWDPGPLGRLYRPKYFHSDGIAVHGYSEVPPYPASHGCVRVSLAAMDWLWDTDQLPIGTAVWVY